MKLKSTLLYITAATLTFSSCQIGKHYTRPELNLPEQLDSTQQDTLTIAEMQWWEIYTDTTLQNLIDKTLEHNKEIRICSMYHFIWNHPMSFCRLIIGITQSKIIIQ